MNNLKELINFYITAKEVTSYETALNKLVLLTQIDNYLEITKTIDTHPNATELDLSMYLNEIATPAYSLLIPIINTKLALFEDIDAIHDLEVALNKIKA